jgi:predicted permease
MFERLYRLVLRFSPREFRDRFGAEMLATARDLDRHRRPGLRPLLRALSDAVAMPVTLRSELRALAPTGPSRSTAMESFTQDLRFASRSLSREPAFTAFVTVALALGIGANAAIFGIADRLLLRGPEHVRDWARVVRLYSTEQPEGMRAFTSSYFGHVSYELLKTGSQAFEGVATYAVNDALLGLGDDAREIKAGHVTADLFPLLGVQPELGRLISDEENRPGAAVRVAVLGYGAWREWYGGSADILGTPITVNDQAFTVIGVAPRGFTGPQFGRVDVWVPASLSGANVTNNWTAAWNAQWLHIVGRLKPGVTLEQASADATAVHRRGYTGDEPPTAKAQHSVRSLQASDTGAEPGEIRVLRWLTGVTLVVLIIACANVANLLLARAVRREREVAIRGALGAGRIRIARLLLLESVMLGLAGAALGLLLAFVLGRSAREMLFASVDWSFAPVDPRIAAVAIGLAVLTGVAIGLLPALKSGRSDLSGMLKSGARDGGGSRYRVRHALTVVQAALSVVLLVGAGLFVRSLWQVHSVDLGIDHDRVLVVNIRHSALSRLPQGPARDAERERRRGFYQQAAERLRGMPGVENAAVAVGTPFGNRFQVLLRVPGRADAPRLPSGGASLSAVGDSYFDTIGTRIIRGRGFTHQDREGTEPVTIVSRTMEEALWPGEDAIGQCLLIGDKEPPCTRVIGIAENTHRSRLREDPVLHYYIPLGHEVRLGFGGSALLVRPSATAGVSPDAIRAFLSKLDPAVLYVYADTIQSVIEPQLRPWRIGASVFLLAGLLALCVSGIGIYSITSYLIADRRREIGVRLALGATGADIARLLFRGSVAMAGIGVIAGLLVAGSLSHLAEPLLFETSPREPSVFAAVSALLLIVALLATIGPARRARRVDPVEALKVE